MKQLRAMAPHHAAAHSYAMEEPLRSEEVFRATLEQAVAQGTEGLAFMDEQGAFVYVNHTCAAMYGFTTSELLGKTWQALYDADQIAVMESRALPALTACGHWRGELVGRRKDGGYLYVELSLQQLTGAQYANTRVACACRDITERKWAEAALRESEERYALALQGSNDGHWDWSLDTNYCYFSPRWKELLGYDDHEVENHHDFFMDRIHPDDLHGVKAAVQAHVSHRAPYHVEIRLRRKSGAYRWFRARGQARWNANGLAVRMAGVLTDITEQKEAQEALRTAYDDLEARVQQRTAELTDVNQELEAFSYSVSHDLRTPLRHIEGFADLLRRHADTKLDETEREYLAMISTAGTRMGLLIDDLLAFSKVGREELRTAPIRLNGLVQEVVRDLQPDVQARRIRWDIHPLPDVVADAALLRLVLANLIGNALKYTRHRPLATIEIGQGDGLRPDEAAVFIRDNGVGFDPRYAHKLFGVFQRLHTANVFEGHGIGLANVRRIIHRHGGRTWAEGQVDAGATFWFSLPIPGRPHGVEGGPTERLS